MASLGVSQDIGNRKEQQDAAFAQDLVNLKGCSILGVFDGHGIGGKKVAEVVASEFINLASKFNNFPSLEEWSQVWNTIRQQTLAVSREFGMNNSGTTATVCISSQEKALLTWIGDSPAFVLEDNQGHVAVNTLTKVHNVSQAEEKEACLALGAKASNDGMHICVQATDSQRREGYAVLECTRALGYESRIIDRKEETLQLQITKDIIGFVLCTDGVTASIRPETFASLAVETEDAQELANYIVREARFMATHRSSDNVSTAVILFQ